MKSGIYMLLKDIVGKLLEHEDYTYELTLYDNNIIEIKYEEGEGGRGMSLNREIVDEGEWVNAKTAEELYGALEKLTKLYRGNSRSGDSTVSTQTWDEAIEDAEEVLQKARGE